ncbi:helix-turn-helix domain-containing protein [Microbacterium sp. BWR-S6Y]|uniref:helix-turn-helix domain-containing protein n=1 Tax=Microbacterium sp. BWR-S6Y TaxID=3232073 RepID=UPI003526DC57
MTMDSHDGRLDQVLRTLADRVRRLREERGLTLLELSFEAGLSESRVRAIEAGRTTASLATLVALAETFEVEIAELFSGSARSAGEGAIETPASAYVVPSEVVWGGELPPAPWLAATPAPAVSPYVVPSEVIWGGDLPAAPWTSATAAPTMPDHPGEPSPPRSQQTPRAGLVGGATGTARREAPLAAPIAPSPARHPVDETSPYVVIASGASTRRQPRTFADLREGALAGREFASLRHFAVAAVVEGGFSTVAVARVFRLPAWKLEQWVVEAGYLRR